MLTPDGLPWTRNGIPRDEDDHDRLIEEKRLARPDNLCRGLPSVFEEFLRYCRRLKFFDQPDYAYWRTAFADVAKQHGFVENDGNVSDELHWPPKPYIVSPASHGTITSFLMLYFVISASDAGYYKEEGEKADDSRSGARESAWRTRKLKLGRQLKKSTRDQ